MVKKSLNVLLILVLVIQTMSSSIMMPTQAIADDESSVFTDITVTDDEGNELNLDEPAKTEVNVQIGWSVAGLEAEKGYTETLTLPAELDVEKDQTGNVTVEEEKTGTFDVSSDNTVKVTFNETIEEYMDGAGSFIFAAKVETEGIYEEDAEDDNANEEAGREHTEADNNNVENNGNEKEESEDTYDDSSAEDNHGSGAEEQQEVAKDNNNSEIDGHQEKSEENAHETDGKSADTKTNEGQSEEENQVFEVRSDDEITENIITGVTLEIDGEELENGDEITVEHPYSESDVVLTYDFALPDGHEYGEGSTFTINVPEMFEIPQVPESEAIPLERGDGAVFGEFYTNGNEVIIVFNENIEGHSEISGNIELESNFDDDYDGIADGDIITFPIEGGQDLEFPIKFIPDANVIEKSGIGNRGYNTETIAWTVDINKNLREINDATLEDVIGDDDGDHSFIEGSLRVYELVMNADGSVAGETELTEHDFGSGFPLDLGNIDSAYRFVYETEVNDATGETYRNTVTLDGDNVDPSTTEASVGVTRGQPLEKGAIDYDDVSQTITWEVRYNYDEKEIPQEQAVLTDIFGNDNLELVEGSFEIVAVDIEPDTGDPTDGPVVDPVDYTVVERDDGFELQFNSDIDGAYKIVYQTTAIERVEGDIDITNTISDEFENESGGDQSISQGIFIKSHGSTNYETKETNWSIVINRDEHVMDDVVFRDTLPEGFALVGDIEVNHEDYDYDYNEETGEIVITFNGTITEQVPIHYTTSIDFDVADRSGSHTNSANLEWIPEGEEDTVNRDGDATFEPDDYTQDNGFKHGSYDMDTKEITWTIGVNYNRETLEGVIVEDFILGNQNFQLGSVNVYEMTLTGNANGYEIGEEVTGGFDIAPVTDSEDNPGFRVTLGDITEPYVIQYTTDFNGEHVAATYNNEATVLSDNKDDIVLDAVVNPNHGGEYVNKSGEQNEDNGRIVNWSIDLNFSQSRVVNYEIVDMLSVNQTIRQETFTVYGTTVSGNNIVKDESTELQEGVHYEVEFTEDEDTGQESFTLTFSDEIEEAYILEYDSYILYEGEGRYGNSAEVSGGIPGDETQTSDNVDTSISFNNISGSITGEVGSLEVTKVDADDEDVTLEGAVFELWDAAGNVLLKTAETDENGIATFTNLLYADYQLRETEAPEFYVAGIEGQQRVTVNAETVEDGITVTNEKIKQHFELTKVDDVDGTPLEDVEFALYQGSYPDGTLIEETYMTNANGQILIEHLLGGNADEGLPAGDYYLIETEPQEHYQLSTEPIEFTITQDQTDVTTETAENSLSPGSLAFEKVDSESEASLEGAEFTLEYLDYDGNDYNTNRTLTTDANGRVEIDDLRPGNYRLTEATPPRGYDFSSDIEEEFEIVESQTTVIDLGQFENDVRETNIVLTKVDSVNNSLTLEGVDFTLSYIGDDYDISDQTRTTDENGEITFEDLKPGQYELVETDVPSDYGYIADADPIPVEVTIDDVHFGDNVEQEVTNDPFVNVTLQKVDSESDVPLEGALFNLLDGDDNIVREDLETDDEGEIRITGLAPGEYTFTETQAPFGYDMGTDNERTFTIRGDETETELEPLEVSNDIIKGSVELTKVNFADDTVTLEDVEFDLVSVDLVNGGTLTVEETGLTTDEDGRIYVDDLRPGTYQFIETTPHDGYQLHWTEVEFTINHDDQPHELEVTVENHELVDIDITKQWDDNYQDEDNSAERPESITVELLQNENLHGTEEIDADGNWSHTFEGLDAVDSGGEFYDYEVRERTEEGYDSEITGDVENGFTITNTVKTTSLELTKQDSINGQFLSGTEFTLTYPDGTKTQTEITEDNGNLTFEDLQPGVYTLTETTPSAGYIANTEPIDITVTLGHVENETVLTEMIENDPFADVTFTKVDAETSVALAGAEFKVVDENGDDVEGFTSLEVENDGTLSITGIPAGDYTLVETRAPTGYELSNEEVEFTVEAGLTTEDIELGNVDNEITRGSVTFTKTDADGETLADVEFLLESTELVNSDDDAYSETHVTNDDGEMSVDNLRPGEYEFTEVVYPDGYQHYTGENLTFTIDPVDGETNIDLGDVINYELVDIEVTKQWNDNNNEGNTRPDEIVIELNQNGTHLEDVTIAPDSDEDWVYTFEGLDAVDLDGNEYIYTIAEQDVDGYQRQGAIEGNAEEGFVITNVLLRDISVEKAWLDDEDATGDRPDSVIIELYQNGTVFGSTTITPDAEEIWSHEFVNLLVYDEDGEEYDYTIEEPDYDENYHLKDVTGDMESGFTVENIRSGTTSITGTKTWLDNDNETEDRPDSINVELIRHTNGTSDENFNQQQEVAPDEDDNWSYEFADLDRFDENGVEYTYEVREEAVPSGYDEISDLDNHDLINLRTGTVEVAGTKIWLDNDDATEDRPSEIAVILNQNGSEVDRETVTVDENWEYSFPDLQEFDGDGVAYEYTVVEEEVPTGYQASYNSESYDITNVRTGTIEVNGEKFWLDGNNPDRPEEIVVILNQNGEEEDRQTVRAADDWEYSFSGIDQFDENGVAYEYTVKEEAVAGYQANYDDNYNITNTLLRSIDVDKTWLDGENAAGDRPEEITVSLYQNGIHLADQDMTLTADDNWSHTFAELPAYDETDELITYTVEESHDAENYRLKETAGDMDTGFEFINVRLVDVDVTKTWRDDNPEDRPEDIVVNLLQDGVVVETAEMTADTDWAYTFTDLDEFNDEGEAYEYTVTEQDVPGYNADVDGFDITNTRSEEKSVTVTKGWLDNDSEDRPASIDVDLLRNGEVYETVEITAENDWSYEFENLEAYDEDGLAIVYAIEEHAVAGYDTEINGFDITNIRSGATSVDVTKAWLDDESPDRPEAIQVNLLQNGNEHSNAEVTAEEGWVYTFSDLPEYDDQGIEYTYTIEEEDVDGYESAIDGYNITNLRVGIISVEGEKTWLDDDSGDRPEEIEVILNQNDDEIARQTVTASEDWSYSFTELPEFDENGAAFEYTVEEQPVEDYEATVDGYDITNVRTGTTSIEGSKTWLDGESADRPEMIEVHLLRNGERDGTTVEVTADEDWAYSFTGLDEFDENGVGYTYTIEEEPLTGYEASYDEYNITNLRVGTIDVDVTKTWRDDDPADRPDDIVVNLLRDGVVVETAEMNADTDWAYTFTGLAEFNDEGEAYEYTVSEHDVPGYNSDVDGFDITNTRSEEKSIAVTKGWLDGDSVDRPTSINVDLLRDGEFAETVEITAEDGWSYEFEDLDAYDEDGHAIAYTIEEHAVTGYDTEINGYDITNVRSGTTSVDVTKAWLDDESPARPESIQVNLLQNGNEFRNAEIRAEDGWVYTFDSLPEYDDQGIEYTYTIEEEEVDGYETLIDGFEITNLRAGIMDVDVTKTWRDDNPTDRPDNITVNLWQNDRVIATADIDAFMEWEYTFTGLAEFNDEGEAYDYTVSEHDVPGYDSEVDGFDITNTRSEEKSITVTKGWLDGDSSNRPLSINVDLLRNGEVEETVEVTAEDGWSYEFEDLDAYDEDGQAIEYTVEEHAVAGYDTEINGYDITNVRSGTTSIEGTKTWRDDNADDRPELITVNLLQDGVVLETKEVTADMGWEYIFTDLAEFNGEGEVYDYAVTEHDVPGYNSEVDSFDITNTRSEEKSVTVTKGWLDDDSADRPTSINVDLLRDGEVAETVEITAEDGWSYEFENLDAYDEDGQAIEYTIEEHDVEGYKTIIAGYDISNVRVGTTSVEGTKTWENDTPEDRPESIVVVLYQNGSQLKTERVTASDDWQYSFTGLPEFDGNGEAFMYTIDEQDVEGYHAEVDGYNITNTLISSGQEEEKSTGTASAASDESEHPDREATDTDEKDEIRLLPSTATDLFNLILFGSGFVIIGLALLLLTQRQRKA